jgi:hypothetical protein
MQALRPYPIPRLCVSPDLRDKAGDKKPFPAGQLHFTPSGNLTSSGMKWERIKVPIPSFRVYFAIILRFGFLARIMSMVDDSVEQLLQREPQWQV